MGSRSRPSQLHAFRLPPDLARKLRARAKKEGRTLSDVVREMLSQGLTGTAGTAEEVQKLGETVEALRREVASLRRDLKGGRR